jgi:hypothetical protein
MHASSARERVTLGRARASATIARLKPSPSRKKSPTDDANDVVSALELGESASFATRDRSMTPLQIDGELAH